MQFATRLTRIRNATCVAFGCAWIGVILVGMALLAEHENQPGAARQAPMNWPRDSQIHLSTNEPTLIMFAHPRCPCTRASLEELRKIVAQHPGAVSPWIVFFEPANADAPWRQTDQWATARSIPGAHVIRDPDGVEARRFDALTSGQTLLYDSAGRLVFSGGITLARGHVGDNAGRFAIESLLTQRPAGNRETPVFGCPILPLTAEK